MLNKKRVSFIAPILFYCVFVMFALFYVFPIIINIYFSFIINGEFPKFSGFLQYILLFEDEKFIISLINTLLFFVISIPSIILLSYLIAKCVVHLPPHLSWVKFPFLIPILIPSASITYVWELLFSHNSFIGKNVFCLYSWKCQWQDLLPVLLLFIWKNLGYHALIFMIGFMLINPSVYEASGLDGANKIQAEYYITLPLMRNSFFISIVFAIVQGLKIGRELLILYGDSPKASLYLLPTYFKELFLTMNIEILSSAAMISMFLILLFILIAYKLLVVKEIQ